MEMLHFIKQGKLLVFLITICATICFSQPSGGPPDDEEPIPIDGGIGLLIGAGLLFGFKSLKNRPKSIK